MNKLLLSSLALAGMTFLGAVEAAAPSTPASTPELDESYYDDRWYVAGWGTFLQPGGAQNAAGGWGAGGGIGKEVNEWLNIEFRGFWQGMNRNGMNYPNNSLAGGRTDMTGGSVDFQYYFWREAFSPYAVLGVGGMNVTTNYNTTSGAGIGASYHSFLFEAGVGGTYELTDYLHLRADVRYRGNLIPSQINTTQVGANNGATYNTSNSVANDMLVNVGFVVPLGDKPEKAAAPVAVADACASKDSDTDGVNDCDDKCAGTAAGTKVDEQGCPIVMELKGVNFHFDSAELTDGAKHILNGVVEQLVAFPASKDLEVAGYASNEGVKGKEQHNLTLSQKRSEAVAHYLKHKGVKNKLFAKGYGTQYPVADNGTEAGREKNRRVELRWMGD
jgi:OOP family OmpA-OmpF porin